MSAAPRVDILIVDDRPGNLLSLQGILERPDYNLVLAASGPEALREVLRHDFALILLDVAMPQMDGFECARIIKQRPRSRLVPIIFVTASVQHIDWIFDAYSVGAVDFLQKPLDPHAVRAKVAVFVELHRQRMQLERQSQQLREAERNERELALTRLKLENERHFRNLAEAIPQVVFTATPDGQWDYVNRRWRIMTGLDEGAALGDGWRQALQPDDAAALDERWRAAHDSDAFEAQCRIRHVNGSARWHLCRAVPERHADGSVLRWLGTFTDIDEQHRAHEESRAAVRLRDEFMSVASHELRTPLTSLQLHVESLAMLLKDGGERVTSKVEVTLRQVRRMALLIDSLLEVSRLSAGQLELQREPLELGALVREVVERFRPEAERAGCEVHLEVAGPAEGEWDHLRLEQVVTNLLSNAIKYGAGKPIEVAVRMADGKPMLSVRDHGIGIQADKLHRIFERYERAVSSRHYGGLGIGLYVADQIVNAHGGVIRVDSLPDQGANFTVELPPHVERPERHAGSEAAHPHH